MDSSTVLLKVSEVAERLGISRSLAYEMALSNQLPVVRIGRRAVRINATALEAWISRNTVIVPREDAA